MDTLQSKFHDWLVENKANFEKLEFRNDEDGCGGVYCTSDIEEDKVFLVIPYEPLVLTDTLARLHLPRSAANLDNRTAIAMYLIQQRLLGDKSFFQPYLNMLPAKIHTALEFDVQDAEFLRGTNAFLSAENRKEELKLKYRVTMDVVGDDMPPEKYTLPLFFWAETVLSSRTFPAHLFGESLESSIVLIPLADMLNHKSRHKVSWIKTPQGLQMSGSAYKKGEQVFNNYGPKDNEDDTLVLKPNFSRDPDRDRKTSILKKAGITKKTIHYLSKNQIPFQLLVTMRVMAMNPVEVDQFYNRMEDEEQKIIHGELKVSVIKDELQFVSVRNELAMLDLIDVLLRSRLAILQEWDAKLGPARNSAQEFALVYRKGQKNILSSCIEIVRGMFSALLENTVHSDLSIEKTVFVGPGHGMETEEGRSLAPSSYSMSYFKDIAGKESKSMIELKLEASSHVLLTATQIMIAQRETVFGEAFLAAFPDQNWGEERDLGLQLEEDEEMALQMQSDAILTCYLIYEYHYPGQLEKFVEAAIKMDYSGQLDEDMEHDVLDLRLSLQETLENVDPEVFDFETKFTPEAFLWATGLIEALSLSLHFDGQMAAGMVAPRG
ncbi:hypothetical protein BGZ94_010225 [Podila epigama]|nr:hypothetical protein BGZ94_010225 [Podila epigama]